MRWSLWMGMCSLDFIADYLRGFDTVMLDIHRYPDKVKKAVEALSEPVIEFALASSKHTGAEIVMCLAFE